MFFIFFTKGLSSLGKLFKHRIVRFLICGIISAAFNTLLLAILVKSFSLGQPIWRNLANFISIEIPVLFSFAIYRLWVWSSHTGQYAKFLGKRFLCITCLVAHRLRQEVSFCFPF
jgi:putative flippase GtrA